MAVTNPYDQYVDNQVMTATPGRLLILTYDAAIRFARASQEAIKNQDYYELSQNIKKAQNVLISLIGALNHEVDEQLTSNLDAIYRYSFDKLSDACVNDNLDSLNEVIHILTDLRLAWVEAEKSVRSGEAFRQQGVQAA